MPKLTITISDAQAKLFRSSCIMRVMKTASQLIAGFSCGSCDDKLETCISDLDESTKPYEDLRNSIVEALGRRDLDAALQMGIQPLSPTAFVTKANQILPPGYALKYLSETGEYRIKFPNGATYFTNDQSDALGTVLMEHRRVLCSMLSLPL